MQHAPAKLTALFVGVTASLFAAAPAQTEAPPLTGDNGSPVLAAPAPAPQPRASGAAIGTADLQARIDSTVDTYFGRPVADPYRWLEKTRDPEVLAWFQAQTGSARATLDALPDRAALARRLAELQDTGATIKGLQVAEDHWFYLKLEPGRNQYRLFVRKGAGGEERLLLDPDRFDRITEGRHEPAAIDWFRAAPNGKRVAVGISVGGNEDSVLHVLDTERGEEIGAPTPGAELSADGLPSWRMDSGALFFNLKQNQPEGAPATDKYRNSAVWMRVFGDATTADLPVFGKLVNAGVDIGPNDIPSVSISPVSSWAIGVLNRGERNDMALYAAPLPALNGASTAWKKIVGPEDGVTAFDVRGDWIYLVSHRGSPRFEVYRMRLSEPGWDNAELVVPASDRVINGVAVAKDALYVHQTDAGYSRVLRLIYNHRYNKAGAAAKPVARAAKEEDAAAPATAAKPAAQASATQAATRTKNKAAAKQKPKKAQTPARPRKATKRRTDAALACVDCRLPPLRVFAAADGPVAAGEFISVVNPKKPAAKAAPGGAKKVAKAKGKAPRQRSSPRNLPPPVAGRVAEQEVQLPFAGYIREMVTDPTQAGMVVRLESWLEAPRYVYINGKTGRADPTSLQPPPKLDLSNMQVTRIQARSHDGTQIPVTVLHRKDLKRDGNAPTVLDAYGAYGVSRNPRFQPTLMAWLERGGVFAVAHVRGGGEFGVDWHEAGRLANKPNSYLDFIAAAEALVAQKYTQPKRLAGVGGSAGGIVVGMAMVSRPTLFGAIVSNAGLHDALRAETAPNGPPNVPEFGSVNTESGYRALDKMSSYHHVVDGTRYPAVLLTAGLNDPRIEAWQPGKMAARLQAVQAGLPEHQRRPVLLRIDNDAGHGLNPSKQQITEDLADRYAFLLSQLR